MAKKKAKEEVVVEPVAEPVNEVLTNRKAALAELMKGINKTVGSNCIQFGLPDLKTSPTGVALLDQLIGGGLMQGKITTMFGAEASGKTSLAATMVAGDQRANPNNVWLWLDFENSLYGNDNATADSSAKASWLATLGIDTERLVFVSSLETMEEYCDICLKLLRSNDNVINGIVIDSVGAMMPQGVAYKKSGKNLSEKSISSDTMGLLPRSLGKFLSCVKGLLAKRNVPMIALTHVYQDINMMGIRVAKGGNAFRHFSDLRLNVQRGPKANWPFNEKVNDKPKFLGYEQVITLDKTKNSNSMPPLTEINLPFMFNKGIDEVRYLANRALFDGFIEQSGAYFYLEYDLSTERPAKERGLKIQGTKQFWNYIDEDDAIRDALKLKYKGVNLFHETKEQLVILNEGEDDDIIGHTVEE